MSGGTGRTGLTLVGQVVGSYFFGPVGGAIGGAIGSAVGSAIWPEQFEGPKLEGLQVTSSAYGGPIPDVYGTVRIGGNIIWASEIRETATTESQGKGGGPEVTSYTYSVDLAIGLCAGPTIGLRRIWADQKLIYDVSTDNIQTLYSSYANNNGLALAFYFGDETQLPNPVLEAALGIGSTPAYRGLCYLVIADFQLGDYGNRVPNITVEIIGGGASGGPRELFSEAFLGSDHWRIAEIGGEMVTIGEDDRPSWVSTLNGTDARRIAYEALPPWPPNQTTDVLSNASNLLLWPYTGEFGIYAFLPVTNTVPGLADTVIAQGSLDEDGQLIPGGTDYTATFTDGGNFLFALAPCADRTHVLAILSTAITGTVPEYWILFRYQPGSFTEVRRGTVDPGLTVYRSAGAMSSNAGSASLYECGMLESDLIHLWQAGSAASQEVILTEIDADGVLAEVFSPSLTFDTPPAVGFTPTAVFADAACCWVIMGGNLYAFTRAPDYTIGVTLAEVVADICRQAGLTPDDIDVTDLESVEVRGYLRTPRMSARSAIEPLMTAYAFDAVESDLKIKFVMRHATSALTIPALDLGAADGEIGDPVLVDSERAQESELPVAIDVSYMAVQADYQIGTQTVRRQVTDSIDQQSLRLALALEDQEAAEICARMIYELWIARNSRKWATTIKYSKYEPTDVVSLEGDSATYTVRITDKREKGNLIEWEGIDVDAAAFNALATAQEVPPGGQTVTLPGLSQGIAIDLPPLREQDFGTTGYYAGGAGLSSPWPGAILYRKPDGGTTYEPELNFLTPATIGATLDALGAHGFDLFGEQIYSGYYPDLVNHVTVALTAGSLSSCTDEEFLNFQNVAVIGKELVAFRDVEAIDANTYRLSCLLRGVQGTEWFAKLDPATHTSTSVEDILSGHSWPETTIQGHRAGDVFMYLDASVIQHYDTGSATTRVGGTAKTVTAGSTLANTGYTTIETTYASVMNPHPTHVEGRMDGTDMILDFAPRTFVGGAWESGHDVTLDPLNKKYIVEITGYDTGSIVESKIVYLDGDPPFTILSTSLPFGSNEYVLRVGALPKALGAAGFGANPQMALRHWSQNITVEA